MGAVRRLFATVLVVSLLASCGTRSGFLRDSSSSNEFQYQMDLVQVTHERTVAGAAEIGMVFCSIPIGSDQYKRAFEELHLKAALNANEMLINFREDSGFTAFLGFYCTHQVTISADVVKLTPKTPPPPVLPPSPPPSN